MKQESLNLLKQTFREFYFKSDGYIEFPARMEEREFGYMQFGSGMVRHLAFKNKNELLALLLKEVPSDVYCSSAYYASPATSPMEEKGFRGSDLIFDIDVKELELKCVNDHSVWLCRDCGNAMLERQNCGRCGSMKLEHVSLPCGNCVDSGKKEVKKLLDVLSEDLGIAEKEYRTYFSGNNGFHIHVYSKEFEPLDSPARGEIANYVMGNNLAPEAFGIRSGKNSLTSVMKKFPGVDAPGWRGRVARRLIDNNEAKLKTVRTILRGGYTKFRDELVSVAGELGAQGLDPKVTSDIHRIFRLQGTLNSKSGLSKAPCNDLENFDPFTSACLLREEERTVHVAYSPRFRLRENSFGPYKDESVKLPAYAAVYLICKGLAEA